MDLEERGRALTKVKRIRDFGVPIGKLPTGPKNAITDVKGVTIGHVTLDQDHAQTGATAIHPHQGNIFQEKLVAASHVINGFGKSMGMMQIDELGTIESPIVLTNTLNVGTAADALIQYMLDKNPDIGRTTGTINPVVAECNDMILNDICAQFVTKEHVLEALKNTSKNVQEGSVGAGRGMVCYSLKGGIGTSSRIIELAHGTYTLGILVLTNFGKLEDLVIHGNPIGKDLKQTLSSLDQPEDKGSIIGIVGTDLPVSSRQLKRILKRSVTGLSRTGSIISHGSGEVFIGFSTATKIPHQKAKDLITLPMIHEEDMNLTFRAMGEVTEEAVLNSLITAESIIGRDGNKRPALKDLLKKYDIKI